MPTPPADKNGHASMVRLFSAAFSGAAHAIEQCVAQDDMVIVRLRITARHTGQFRDIAATGNAIDVTQYRSFRIAGARIVEHWALFDTAGLLRQLQPALAVAGAGVAPPPARRRPRCCSRPAASPRRRCHARYSGSRR